MLTHAIVQRESAEGKHIQELYYTKTHPDVGKATHTHTHTHREREIERERIRNKCESTNKKDSVRVYMAVTNAAAVD